MSKTDVEPSPMDQGNIIKRGTPQWQLLVKIIYERLVRQGPQPETPPEKPASTPHSNS